MNSRHRAREVALQILYHYDVAQQPPLPNSDRDHVHSGPPVIKAVKPASAAAAAPPPITAKTPAQLLKELNAHFDHFQVEAGLREFAAQLVAGTLRELAELDTLLEKHTSNWRISRMALVDRSLLRMAAYELKSFPDTPASVVIDEAVELAKQFGNAETPAFINGVLDAVKTSVR